MPGFSSITGDESIMFVDNASFDGTDRGGKLTTNGQVWIGSTISPHVQKGSFTSPLGTIAIGYSSPNITLDVSGSGDLHVARFIVSAGGHANGANYTSIASAYAAAVGAGGNQTVFIQPGIYTENITLSANVNLCAFDCDAFTPNVTIVGKLSGSYVGIASISGIQLKTNGDFSIAVTGAASTQLFIKNCWVNVFDHTFLSMTSSGGGSAQFIDCFGNTAAAGIAYFSQSNGLVRIIDCYFLNDGGSTTASTVSGGTLTLFGSSFGSPITGSSTANIGIDTCTIGLPVILNNTSSNTIFRSLIQGGTSTALSIGVGATLSAFDLTIQSSNTNAISGAGTLQATDINFIGTSSGINTTIQTPLTLSLGAMKVVNPAGDYTVLNFDYFVGADTSGARAITLPASPSTGELHRIKDITGTAAAFNITISGNGHNIDGAATKVISTNYGSVDVLYNGTNWFII